MSRFALIAGLLLLIVVYYYVFGYGPTASEIYDEREWWQPRGWIHQWWGLSALSAMARSEEATRWIPVALFSLPPALGIVAGIRLFRGAVMRSVVVVLGAVLIAFAYYGCLNDSTWRFFEWRWALVIASFAAVVVIASFGPSLLRSLNRAPRAIGAAALLAVAALIFVLNTEVTGTNTELSFNISPWPLVTVFGMLLLGMLVSATHIAAGAGLLARSRVPGGAGIAAALGVALVVGAAAAFIPFSAPSAGNMVTVGILSVIYAAIAIWRTESDQLQNSALSRLAAGLLIFAFVGVSNQIAVSFQKTARDETARTLLLALEAYKADNGGYPERLRMLKPEYLAEVPRPQIGYGLSRGLFQLHETVGQALGFVDEYGSGMVPDEDEFVYSKYSQEDYSIEFSSVQWVQCAYSPPYQFASFDEDEDEEDQFASFDEDDEEEPWESWDNENPTDVAAGPTADQLATQAILEEAGLAGKWSCATEPPKLW
jgi:hypothetical protein